MILFSGWRLLRESVGGLMDEAVPPELLAQHPRAWSPAQAEGALEAHDLRTRTGRAAHLRRVPPRRPRRHDGGRGARHLRPHGSGAEGGARAAPSSPSTWSPRARRSTAGWWCCDRRPGRAPGRVLRLLPLPRGAPPAPQRAAVSWRPGLRLAVAAGARGGGGGGVVAGPTPAAARTGDRGRRARGLGQPRRHRSTGPSGCRAASARRGRRTARSGTRPRRSPCRRRLAPSRNNPAAAPHRSPAATARAGAPRARGPLGTAAAPQVVTAGPASAARKRRPRRRLRSSPAARAPRPSPRASPAVPADEPRPLPPPRRRPRSPGAARRGRPKPRRPIPSPAPCAWGGPARARAASSAAACPEVIRYPARGAGPGHHRRGGPPVPDLRRRARGGGPRDRVSGGSCSTRRRARHPALPLPAHPPRRRAVWGTRSLRVVFSID